MLTKIQTLNQIVNKFRIINKIFRLIKMKDKTRIPKHHQTKLQINKLTKIQKIQMILSIQIKIEEELISSQTMVEGKKRELT